MRVVVFVRFDEDHESSASRAYVDGVLGAGGLRTEARTWLLDDELLKRRDALFALAAVPCDEWLAKRRARLGTEGDVLEAVRARAAWHDAVLLTLPVDRLILRNPTDDEAFLDDVSSTTGVALGPRAPRPRRAEPFLATSAAVRSRALAAASLGPRSSPADRAARRRAVFICESRVVVAAAPDAEGAVRRRTGAPAFSSRRPKAASAPRPRWVSRRASPPRGGSSARPATRFGPRTGARGSTSSCRRCASTPWRYQKWRRSPSRRAWAASTSTSSSTRRPPTASGARS